nr:hypothetical protein Q903MT_gene6250 [Picea sitchensis]
MLIRTSKLEGQRILINPFSFSPDDPEPLQARVSRALTGTFPVAKGRFSPLFIPVMNYICNYALEELRKELISGFICSSGYELYT